MLYVFFDFNQFFVQCEINRHPELASKAVVIGIYSGRSERSGSVSTSSYRARQLGIRSGMPLFQAYNIAEESGEEVVFIPADHDYYESISAKLFGLISNFGEPKQLSIDEGYIALPRASHEDALALAQKLKQAVEAEGYPISIGIADTVVLAKIASSMKKGILYVENPIEFLSKLDIKEVPGIGKKTEQILKANNINTVGDLQKQDVALLTSLLGKSHGKYLYMVSRNLPTDYLHVEDRAKQISRMVTLKRDSDDPEELREVLYSLADEISETLYQSSLGFQGITVNAVTRDIKAYSRTRKLLKPATSKDYLKRIGFELLVILCKDVRNSELSIRRLGLGVFLLTDMKNQTKLF